MTEKIATSAAYSTSIVTVIAGLTMNELAAMLGIIGVLGTLAMNWYFKRREFNNASAEHEIRIAKERLELELRRIELEGVKLRKESR